VTAILSQNVAPTPLLDLLTGSTNVIFAGSIARKLKGTASFAYNAFDKGSGSSHAQIGFTRLGLADTNTLLALAAGQTAGNQAVGLGILNDQTGNSNFMGRPTFSHYCPLTTAAGALNAQTTVHGGAVMPMFSTGYNGLQAANSGPYLTSGSWNGVVNSDLTPGPMAVSFGASAKFWCFDVVRPKSGMGNASGRIASFTHTGDSNDNTTTTSAALLLLNGSTTSGAMRALADGSTLSTGTATPGILWLVGSVFDGSENTLYINGVAQTAVAYGNTLGSGGVYALGEIANVGPFGSAPFAGDRIEHICGTTLNTGGGDLTLIQSNMMAFYGIT
jgi:hypothetical protein